MEIDNDKASTLIRSVGKKLQGDLPDTAFVLITPEGLYSPMNSQDSIELVTIALYVMCGGDPEAVIQSLASVVTSIGVTPIDIRVGNLDEH